MLLKGLELMVLLYYANAQQTVTISTNKDYYIPFQTIEINCTMSVYEDHGTTLSIASQLLCIIFRKNDACKISFGHTPGSLCQGECSCSLNGKSFSYVYNVTENVDVLPIRCSVSSGIVKTREIKRGKEPENIEVNTSSPMEVVERQNVGPLKCSAECVPDCTFSWTSPDGLMTHGKIFKKNDVNRTDNGSYICSAENVLGSKQETIDMIVQYGPSKVKLNPSNQTYTEQEGNSLGFISCSSQCYPECTRIWTGPGINSSENVLNLSRLNRRNSGQFICTASNKVRTLQTTVNVTVQYGPQQAYLNTSSPITVIEGQSVGPISCTADCVPDCNYTWTGPGDWIGDRSILQINDIGRTDNGIYTCKAVNKYEESERNITIIVQYGPNEVTLSPLNKSYIREEGKSLESISCSSNCYPECNITWTGPGINPTANILSLTGINRNNTGQFVCNSTNDFGSLQTVINVTVHYGPGLVSFNTSPQVTVNERQSVGPILCRADCIPDCTYSWSGSNALTRNNSILLINNINRTYSGSYTCEAVNKIRASTGSVLITVQYGPGAVSFNSSELIFKQEEGTKFGPIYCDAECSPKCDLEWIRKGQTSPANPLYIAKVSRNNTGQFICNASNILGNSQGSIQLTVQYAAEVTVINITNSDKDYVLERTTVHFTCGAIGEPKPTIRWLYTDLSGNTKLASASSQFDLIDASCKETGRYTCEAETEGFPPHNITRELNVTCSPGSYALCSDCNSNLLAVKRNETESISVCFLSNPTPEIQWNATMVNNSTSLVETVSQTYNYSHFLFTSIFDVSLVDAKEITLTVSAENFFGSSMTTCRILIRDKPFKPKGVYVSCLEITMIYWYSDFDGGIEQLFTVYYIENNKTLFQSAENISDKGFNKRHHYEITDLKPSSDYSFYVVSMNAIDTTRSKIVTCTTPSVSRISLNIAALGAGTAAGIVFVSLLLIGLLFFKRRLSMNASEKRRSLIQGFPANQDEDDNTDGLKDNPIYESHDDTNVEYSVVPKTGKRQKVYENADDFKKNATGKIYENQMSMVKMPKEIVVRPKKNKDGLIYADLDLAPCGSRFVVRGLENKTNYAMIDLTKTAEPLPSSDEDDTKHTEK